MGHLVPQAQREPLSRPLRLDELGDEDRERVRTLQAEINRLDAAVRSLPGDRFTNPTMAAAQDERNAKQAELDAITVPGHARSVEEFAAKQDEREGRLDEETRQLASAQNAPFPGGPATVPGTEDEEQESTAADPRVNPPAVLSTGGETHL